MSQKQIEQRQRFKAQQERYSILREQKKEYSRRLGNARCRDYYQDHKEHIAQRMHNWYVQHRDEIRAKNKERNRLYYAKNKDAINARARARYAAAHEA